MTYKKSNMISGIIDSRIRIREAFAAGKIYKKMDLKKYLMLLIVKTCFGIFVDEMSFLKKLAADSVWNDCK